MQIHCHNLMTYSCIFCAIALSLSVDENDHFRVVLPFFLEELVSDIRSKGALQLPGTLQHIRCFIAERMRYNALVQLILEKLIPLMQGTKCYRLIRTL